MSLLPLAPHPTTCAQQRLVPWCDGQHPIDAAPPQHAAAAIAADGRNTLGPLDDLLVWRGCGIVGRGGLCKLKK